MAETISSPGTIARENDQSQVKGQPLKYGAAIVGPTAKGPVEIPTLVTSYSEFISVFGDKVESGSNSYSYFTSIAANNYFQNGGTSLLVSRVTSGSFSPAVNTTVPSIASTGSAPFVLETLSEGEIMNSTSTEGTNNSLPSGSSDNVRWEIASVNTGSGTFSLLIRRGDDTINKKVILESYNNLSLDPYASNYISKVIGDMSKTLVNSGADWYVQESGSYSNISRYVRVKSVDLKTPKYFDNAGFPKAAFTGSLPRVSSGSFESATGSNIPVGRTANFYQDVNDTDTQGLVGGDYTNIIALLSNVDEYKFNCIVAPGLIYNQASHATPLTSLVNNSIYRGDSIAIIDLVPYNSQVNTVASVASSFDSSYAATYWPWLQTIDPNTGEAVYVPASTMIPGVFAYTNATSAPWFAPAGITRGSLGQVTRAERKLSPGQRDTLYEANVNPIATFPNAGVVVFGQKTLQKKSSATDRINVRNLLIELKSYISQVGDTLVFDGNTIATRNSFLSQVNPYLESVQQRQGLYAFKVEMSDLNNTNDVIDRNELVGQIFLQPTKTGEFVILDFNVLPTGALFPS